MRGGIQRQKSNGCQPNSHTAARTLTRYCSLIFSVGVFRIGGGAYSVCYYSVDSFVTIVKFAIYVMSYLLTFIVVYVPTKFLHCNYYTKSGHY